MPTGPSRSSRMTRGTHAQPSMTPPSQKIRQVWMEFQFWHERQKLLCDEQRQQLIQDIQGKLDRQRAFTDVATLIQQYEQQKKNIEETLEASKVDDARDEWERRLTAAGLIMDNWEDMTQEETETFKEVFGFQDEDDMDDVESVDDGRSPTPTPTSYGRPRQGTNGVSQVQDGKSVPAPSRPEVSSVRPPRQNGLGEPPSPSNKATGWHGWVPEQGMREMDRSANRSGGSSYGAPANGYNQPSVSRDNSAGSGSLYFWVPPTEIKRTDRITNGSASSANGPGSYSDIPTLPPRPKSAAPRISQEPSNGRGGETTAEWGVARGTATGNDLRPPRPLPVSRDNSAGFPTTSNGAVYDVPTMKPIGGDAYPPRKFIPLALLAHYDKDFEEAEFTLLRIQSREREIRRYHHYAAELDIELCRNLAHTKPSEVNKRRELIVAHENECKTLIEYLRGRRHSEKESETKARLGESTEVEGWRSKLGILAAQTATATALCGPRADVLENGTDNSGARAGARRQNVNGVDWASNPANAAQAIRNGRTAMNGLGARVDSPFSLPEKIGPTRSTNGINAGPEFVQGSSSRAGAGSSVNPTSAQRARRLSNDIGLGSRPGFDGNEASSNGKGEDDKKRKNRSPGPGGEGRNGDERWRQLLSSGMDFLEGGGAKVEVPNDGAKRQVRFEIFRPNPAAFESETSSLSEQDLQVSAESIWGTSESETPFQEEEDDDDAMSVDSDDLQSESDERPGKQHESDRLGAGLSGAKLNLNELLSMGKGMNSGNAMKKQFGAVGEEEEFAFDDESAGDGNALEPKIAQKGNEGAKVTNKKGSNESPKNDKTTTPKGALSGKASGGKGKGKSSTKGRR